MPYLKLTLHQMKLLRHLVQHSAHGAFVWSDENGGIVHIQSLPVPQAAAALADLPALEAYDLVTLVVKSRFTDGKLTSHAHRAVLENFGMRPRDIVLRAAYELTDADPSQEVRASAIAEVTGLSLREVIRLAEQLDRREHLTSVYDNGDDDPFWSLTDAGIDAIETPVSASPGAVHVSHSQNVQIVAGSNIRASAHQSVDSDAELRAKIVELSAEMVKALQSAPPAIALLRSEVEAVTAEVERGNDPASTAEKARSLGHRLLEGLKATGKAAESINAICDAINRYTPWMTMVVQWAASFVR
jgi:hypothetical protein